ncbi:CHAT domain-containing protein [Aspergillus californicus]
MDHSPIAAHLGREGHALLRRYQETGEVDHLDESINLARQALASARLHERAIYLNDLGSRLRERFEACRRIGDISEAIELVEESSQTIGDPSQQVIVLNNLATFLGDRFECSQDANDLERAVAAASHGLELGTSGAAFQAECKNTLGLIYGYRYTKTGNADDLEAATRLAQEAVEMTDPDDENLAIFLGYLGICYERWFERRGHPDDIHRAVHCAQQTVDSTNAVDSTGEESSCNNPAERSLYLKNLSNALGRRFAVSHNLQDLDDAIHHGIEAANLIPGHARWSEILHNVSLLLEDRFIRLGDISDLEEAITSEKTAISAIPMDDLRLLVLWDQLGVLYGRKFDFTGEIHDLDTSIEFSQQTIDTSNQNDLDAVGFKWHMALALNRRFEYLSTTEDLDRAILLGTEALQALAQDDIRRVNLLLDLSDFQHSKYLESGLMEHFQVAAGLAGKAMAIDVPPGFSQPLQLCTMSRRSKERYTLTKSEDDIRLAIELAEKAFNSVPPEHPHAPYCLWFLSHALETRYRVQGSLPDLDRAIQTSQDALAIGSIGSLDWAEMSYSLSVQLTHRYEQLGAHIDLEESIQRMRELMDGMPDGIRFGLVVCLKSLSDQLGYLFERTGDMSTLTEAIDAANQASETYTDRDISKASILNSLGLHLKARFGFTGLYDYLKAAVDVQREVLGILPRHDPERSIALYNASSTLTDLFRHTKDPEDLAQATNLAWQALDASAESHPNRAMYLNLTGMLLQENLDNKDGTLETPHNPVVLFTEALGHENSPPLDRIKAGQNAFHCCVTHGEWGAATSVAADVVKLFPLLVPRWMSRDDQQQLLKNISHFTSLAASAVLHVGGSPASALQILETGRGVIAGLTIDLKAEISALEEAQPDLYEKYTELRRRILLSTTLSLSMATETDQTLSPIKVRRKPRVRSAAGPERTRDLKVLEDLESQIRAVPGFENFLNRLSDGEYISLAAAGPIVTFNVTQYRSDALIINSTGVTSIKLDSLRFRDMKIHVPKVAGKTQLSKGGPSTRRQRNEDLQNMLRWLWDTAALPVLTTLGLFTHGYNSGSALPRIWWVASGYMGLFPIHAAGDGNGTALIDYAISSYTPTLEILRFSRVRPGQRRAGRNLNMLLVPAPTKTGQQDLDTESEIRSIMEYSDSIATHTILHRPSREDVMQGLPNSHLLHFSCHAEANPKDPSKSALILSPAEGTSSAQAHSLLTVTDLATISHANAQLVYLSACSTAENSSDDLLDEAIHIASAFQLIGFPHVIGTLWEIRDRAAVAVSRLFYEELGHRIPATDTGGGGDLNTIIPYALHEALQHYRRSKGVMRGNDVLSWAPFIHMGA